VSVEGVEDGVVAAGDLLALVDLARQVVPGVDGEGVVLAAGGALTRELIVIGLQSKVEARSNAVVRVREDVK
jgi:hypothetical protein